MNYDKQSLIENHLGLAESIATREWRTAPYALEKAEMLGLANLGLILAADRWESYCKEKGFDPTAVQYFKGWAGLRIRGSIRDELRKRDWATRTLRSKSKRLKNAGQDEGLSVAQLAEKTGMSVAEINKVMTKLSLRPVSLDANYSTVDNSDSKEVQLKEDIDTEGIAFANSMVAQFVQTYKVLEDCAKVVLALHYYDKMDLRHIAEELELPESKVSQIHAEGVLTIKNAMAKAATIGEK